VSPAAAERASYVLDIETVGVPWKSLDDRTREYLLGRGKTDSDKEAIPMRLGLSPGTGRVIVVGMFNLEKGTGGMLVEGKSKGWHDGGPKGFRRFDGDEREILAEIWKMLSRTRRVVTFNGRSFDGPYLMLRSAMLGVPPTLNLAGPRFQLDPHCDLAEVLTFHGAIGHDRSYGLDYWCRRFGITSPKEEGLEGSLVQSYYDSGRLEEIVQYCARDVEATTELYRRLEATLLPLFRR